MTCSSAINGLLVLGTDQGELLIFQLIKVTLSARPFWNCPLSIIVSTPTSNQLCVFYQARTSASCVSVVSANSRSVLAICISQDKLSKPVVKSEDKVSKPAVKSTREDVWLGTIAACGEDCAITVVKILASGSLQISHKLQVILIVISRKYFR